MVIISADYRYHIHVKYCITCTLKMCEQTRNLTYKGYFQLKETCNLTKYVIIEFWIRFVKVVLRSVALESLIQKSSHLPESSLQLQISIYIYICTYVNIYIYILHYIYIYILHYIIYIIYNTVICHHYSIILTIDNIYICTVRKSRHNNHSNVQLKVIYYFH